MYSLSVLSLNLSPFLRLSSLDNFSETTILLFSLYSSPLVLFLRDINPSGEENGTINWIDWLVSLFSISTDSLLAIKTSLILSIFLILSTSLFFSFSVTSGLNVTSIW